MNPFSITCRLVFPCLAGPNLDAGLMRFTKIRQLVRDRGCLRCHLWRAPLQPPAATSGMCAAAKGSVTSFGSTEPKADRKARCRVDWRRIWCDVIGWGRRIVRGGWCAVIAGHRVVARWRIGNWRLAIAKPPMLAPPMFVLSPPPALVAAPPTMSVLIGPGRAASRDHPKETYRSHGRCDHSHNPDPYSDAGNPAPITDRNTLIVATWRRSGTHLLGQATLSFGGAAPRVRSRGG